MQAKFTLVHETPGALRYAEILPDGSLARYPNSPGAIIGTLYVRKSAFRGSTNFPKQITVTITEGS